MPYPVHNADAFPWPKLDLIKLLRDLAGAVEAGRVFDAPRIQVDRAIWTPGCPDGCTTAARYQIGLMTNLFVDMEPRVEQLTFSGWPYDAMPLSGGQWRHR